MSAFMLLSANQNIAYQQHKYTQRQLRKKKSSIEKRRALSIVSESSSLRRHDTTTSLNSSKSLEHKKLSKVVYDVNTNQYVPRGSIMTTVEKRVDSYERKLSKLMKSLTKRNLNDKLNQHYGSGDSLLFSNKNLDVLRHTYFHHFEYDYELIEREINAKRNGRPKLKYVRKINKLKNQDERVTKNTVNGLPSFSRESLLEETESVNTEDIVTSESDDHLDYSEDEDLISMFKSTKFEEDQSFHSTERIYQEYSTFHSAYESNGNANIRRIIKSNQFWNNVYQDIKFCMNESAINYFELLPNIKYTITFFGDLLDYFLYNIQVLKIEKLDGIESAEDIEELKKHCYFYFKDQKYDYLTLMSKMHHRMYLDQSLLNHNMSTPSSLIYNTGQSIDSIQSDSVVHKKLMNKLIEAMMDNLKSSVGISNRKSQFVQLFDLWQRFLKFLVFEVLVEKDCIQSSPLNYRTISFDNEYPEPTIDELSRSNDYHVSPKQGKFYHPPSNFSPSKPPRLSVEVGRHTSISSSRSLTPSSVMSSPRAKCKSSFASTLASTITSNDGGLSPSSSPSEAYLPMTPDLLRQDNTTISPIKENKLEPTPSRKSGRLFFGRFKR